MTSRRVSAGAQAASVITCTGAFRNNRAYDRPHPGRSSARRAINAHLAIRCTGTGAGLTHVTVVSRMKDGRRTGAAGRDSGFRSARTGGDLRCLRKKRAYFAKGRVTIKFPPRYQPPTASASPVSVRRVFKRGGKGVCVRP